MTQPTYLYHIFSIKETLLHYLSSVANHQARKRIDNNI